MDTCKSILTPGGTNRMREDGAIFWCRYLHQTLAATQTEDRIISMQAIDGGNDIKGAKQHSGKHCGHHAIEKITHLFIQAVDISELGVTAVAITFAATAAASSAPLLLRLGHHYDTTISACH